MLTVRTLPWVWGCWWVVGLLVWAEEPRREESRWVERAEAILAAYHGESPPADERLLHVVYFTPADREPAADWDARWQRILTEIEQYFADEMQRHGLGRRTIRLDRDDAGRIRIHLVRGAANYDDYRPQDGARIRGEALPVLREAGIRGDDETVLYICHLTEWDGQTIRQKSPYYGGGGPRGGSAWVADSELLDPLNLPKSEPRIRDSQYGRISLGRHNTIFLGGTAHELGHGLGLPHNRERPDEAGRGRALMGSGNMTYREELRDEGLGSFLTLAHALRLRTHPQFSGTMQGLDVQATCTLSDRAARVDGDTLEFSGRLQADPPIYAVVGYFDPVGGGDYDATTAVAVPDDAGRFTLRTAALKPGSPAELRVVACHASGDTTTFRYNYSVEDDGRPNIDRMQEMFLLAPLADAIRDRNRDEAQRLAKSLGQQGASPSVETLAQALIATHFAPPDVQDLATIPADERSVDLGSIRPAEVRVGWMRPTFNRLPDNRRLLQSGGRYYAQGVYAHAPARHVYAVNDQWQRLTGRAGLQDGNNGSVVFVIRGDDRELWRSELIRGGMQAEYNVDLAGVKQLELVVEDGGDGNGADWGLWLVPRLAR